MKARRQRSRTSTRATRRSQRGGASAATAFARLGDRRAAWAAALQASLPAVAPILSAAEDSQEFVSAWIAAIGDQDALLTMALDLFKRAATPTLSPDFSNVTEFQSAANKELLKAYVEDAVTMIQYTLTKVSRTAPTKISSLLDDTNTPLLKVVLFPKLMTNTFVQSLAGIFMSLREKESLFTNTSAYPSLHQLLEKQFTDIVTVNALYLTSTEPRDGFFLDQSTREFSSTLDVFFGTMLTELRGLITVTDTAELFKVTRGVECPYDITSMSWPQIAAHMARWYMLRGSLDGLFGQFKVCPGDVAPEALAHLPDSVTNDAIVYDGAPLKAILLSVTPVTFQFMVHLRTVLTRMMAETSAPASSPEIDV